MPDVQRIVVNTHVFLRALVGDAPEKETYDRLIEICYRVVVNDRILDEYGRISNRLGLTAQAIDKEIARLKSIGKVEQSGNPRRRIDVGPEQDRPFLRCAMAARAAYILTNDERLKRANGDLHRKYATYRTEAIGPVDFLRLVSGS